MMTLKGRGEERSLAVHIIHILLCYLYFAITVRDDSYFLTCAAAINILRGESTKVYIQSMSQTFKKVFLPLSNPRTIFMAELLLYLDIQRMNHFAIKVSAYV